MRSFDNSAFLKCLEVIHSLTLQLLFPPYVKEKYQRSLVLDFMVPYLVLARECLF